MADLTDPPVPFNPSTDKPVAVRGEGGGASILRVTGLATEAYVQSVTAAAVAAIEPDLAGVNDAKIAIRGAIVAKGVDMTDVPFSGYAAKIAEIETGGGQAVEIVSVAFSAPAAFTGTEISIAAQFWANQDTEIEYEWLEDNEVVHTGQSYTPDTGGVELVGRLTLTTGAQVLTQSTAPLVVNATQTAPAVLTNPTISGLGEIGATLTQVSAGTYSGAPTPTLTRNWQADGVDISGATGTTYEIPEGSEGVEFRLRVRATNPAGFVDAFSARIIVDPETSEGFDYAIEFPLEG